MLTVFVAQLVFQSIQVLAVVPCPPPTGLNKNVDLIHKVVQVVPFDQRETFEEYAAKRPVKESMDSQFGATGMVVCDDRYLSSGQVSVKNNIVTTAAHSFLTKDCKRQVFPSGCYFSTSSTPGKKYPIDLNSLKTGKDCDASNDWAVVKLKEPTPESIKPYQLPPEDLQLRRNHPLIHVVGYSKDFERNGRYTRHIQHCRVRGVGFTSRAPVRTDCTTSGGSSGSVQLIRTPNGFAMGAININEVADAKPGSGYNEDHLYNGSVPVAGEFRKAILEMAGD